MLLAIFVTANVSITVGYDVPPKAMGLAIETGALIHAAKLLLVEAYDTLGFFRLGVLLPFKPGSFCVDPSPEDQVRSLHLELIAVLLALRHHFLVCQLTQPFPSITRINIH